ncbi:MAG TPA: hypothetical protein VF244_02545 [Acidimicrobiales bacterium]
MAPRPVQGTPKGTTVVLTGIAGVLGGILVFAIVTNLVGSRADKADSPAATFDVGPAEQRARTIARGGPILFQDLLNRSRDIYVQHLGGDDWRAFEAHALDAPRRCFVEWRAATREFVDGCDGRVFPADGTGLVQYPARVDERGHVVVDLRTPAPATSPAVTTTTPTTTTTPVETTTTTGAPPPA